MEPIKRYKKENPFSYTLGIAPTLELLTVKPELAGQVILSTNSTESAKVAAIVELCKARNIPFSYNDKNLKMLSENENTYVACEFEKTQTELSESNTVVLYHPSDMGNLGSIFRTLVGFGVANVILIMPCADAFEPKVVRASMGAIFHLNIRVTDDLEKSVKGFENTYFSFPKVKPDISKVAIKEPWCLVFGSEGEGLPEKYQKEQGAFSIPQRVLIDSYNLAVSVGISIYEFTKNGRN